MDRSRRWGRTEGIAGEGALAGGPREGVTEIVKIPNRGHSLTIDSGWREVADTALAFVQKHGPKA
jgi:hypothetical protein